MSNGNWSPRARHWKYVRPPLRPAQEDIGIFQAAIDGWFATHCRAPRALILGVTPELHNLRWPTGTSPCALDGSRQMIDTLWPGPPGTAVAGSWTDMPLATDSRDIVFCDGGFGLLPYPEGQTKLLRELRRILVSGGVFVVRLFAPSGRTGTVEQVFANLGAGDIASLDELKLLLWGALHVDPHQGVRPRDVVTRILAAVGDLGQLGIHGWPMEHVKSLELHRDSKATYHLTEADEVVRMAASNPGGFESCGISEPGYALGNCCPIVTLKRI